MFPFRSFSSDCHRHVTRESWFMCVHFFLKFLTLTTLVYMWKLSDITCFENFDGSYVSVLTVDAKHNNTSMWVMFTYYIINTGNKSKSSWDYAFNSYKPVDV